MIHELWIFIFITNIIILASKKKFSNSDIMYVKNLKDTKIASDLESFHTVGSSKRDLVHETLFWNGETRGGRSKRLNLEEISFVDNPFLNFRI